jgi:acyl carrier protein
VDFELTEIPGGGSADRAADGRAMTTADALREFIGRDLASGRPAAELTDDFPLIRERVVDSLGVFQLVSFIEGELGVQVGDDEVVLENFETIAALAAFIDAKRAC